MNKGGYIYVVSNISLPVHASFEEAFSVAIAKFKSAGISARRENLYVFRRSIDARKRSNIKFVYSVALASDIAVKDPSLLLKRGISYVRKTKPEIYLGTKRIEAPVAVIGAGPAGLFSALMLAEAGFAVVILERGGNVRERKAAVADFIRTRILDPSTNIQFGAGGAGTFSDGKLVTRINDPISSYVLDRLVDFGAPEEILYLAKPHVGTDILSALVDNMLSHLEKLGVTVMYHTEMLDLEETSGTVTHIKTNRGDIRCSAVIMAIGHSARNTYRTLIDRDMEIEAKDFSVGLRIEHARETIDRGLYGDMAGDPALPPGEYALSYNTEDRGAYTFCMCPGGEVVAATSEEGGVVVNGMSEHSRSGRNSNSAVCCSVFKADYGHTPIRAIEFQEKIERAAFMAGGGDYSAPIITVGDFLKGECSREPYDVFPTYMNGKGVKLAAPDKYLPELVTNSIRNAICNFDTKIPGFASHGAVLSGPETRTSAPLRIRRDSESKLATGYNNLYPCGEGAGYAGGITSAAIDGIKCALALMKNYKP